MSSRNLAILAVAAAVALTLFFGLAWISRPGPNEDEMLFLVGAIPDSPFPYAGAIRIFKHDVPVMLLPYLGATKGLLWRLVFLFWSPTIYSARIPTLFLAAFSLVLFYKWARRYYSPGIAATAVLLAGADTSYIFTARLDLGFVVIHRLLMPAGLLLATRWLDSSAENKRDKLPAAGSESGFGELPAASASVTAGAGRAVAAAMQRTATPASTRALAWLAASGFCFGLGLWDKTSFAWFLIALSVTLLALFPRDVMRRLRPGPVGVFLLALCIGAFPLIRYNLSKSGGRTYNAVHVTLKPAEILDKIGKISLTFDGRFIYGWVSLWAFDPVKAEAQADGPGKLLALVSRFSPSWGTLLPWVAGLALLAACIARGKRRQILFPLVLTALMWVQVLPLKEGGGPHHFILAYPFPHLAIAAAAAWAWHRLRGIVRLVPVVIVSATIITMVGWDARTLWAFRETGGAWNWSDAIYNIAAYLEKKPPQKLMCMDWGFSYPLMLLTQNRLKQQDFFADVVYLWPEDPPKRVRHMISALLQPNTLYLFHAGDYQNFPGARQVFKEALKQTGMHERVVATFKQSNGDDVAILSEVLQGSGQPQKAHSSELSFRITPAEVSPGSEYAIECPELAGKDVDLLYVRASEPAEVAAHFSRLDSKGTFIVKMPTLTPKGKIQIMAVRESGTEAWRPVSAILLVK